jgi:hypothetical protein
VRLARETVKRGGVGMDEQFTEIFQPPESDPDMPAPYIVQVDWWTNTVTITWAYWP